MWLFYVVLILDFFGKKWGVSAVRIGAVKGLLGFAEGDTWIC
jgi:hypothetical protein